MESEVDKINVLESPGPAPITAIDKTEATGIFGFYKLIWMKMCTKRQKFQKVKQLILLHLFRECTFNKTLATIFFSTRYLLLKEHSINDKNPYQVTRINTN